MSLRDRLDRASLSLEKALAEIDAVQAQLQGTVTYDSDLEGLSAQAIDALTIRGIYRGNPEALIHDDGIVSMIDGKRHVKLKSHLRRHGLTPERYRALFGLPEDFAMTPPAFSAHMAASAKAQGLGKHART